MATSETQPSAADRHRATWAKLRAQLRVLRRSWVRNNDLGLVVTAAAVGALVGLGVVATHELVAALHHLFFGVSLDEHLSSAEDIAWWRVLLVPLVGGLAYGLFVHLARRFWSGDIVDAIEANALYGGRMSLADSLRLTVYTVFSVGVGGSVGLEAAYTQLGAGFGSWLGQQLRLRRNDLRTFVGCGAAAAIAAAFNAPLAGAFYAFELVIGSYTLATLAPVASAALVGTLVERQLRGSEPIFVVYQHLALNAPHYLLLALVGIGAGILGILAMIGVTMVETWFQRLELPGWLRPAAGGGLLASMAVIYPQVLGSGQGGIIVALTTGYALPLLLGLLAAKLVGSAVSIGGGFRGGMFSSSLFLGALFGSVFAAIVRLYTPSLIPDPVLFALAGMGAVGAAVVGAPITMVLLVLEVTSDFEATIGVTAAVVLASFVVRHWFGYSFATWRFHVRGVAVRGGHDVGWLQDLTVARVMRRGAPIAAKDMPVEELRAAYPPGAAKYLYLIDEQQHYAGVVDLHEVHSDAKGGETAPAVAADLVADQTHYLLPGQPLRLALDLFAAADAEALVVLDNAVDRHILGYLTEAYALRRYNRELEERRREELGESEVFSPPPVVGAEARNAE
jgi:CIC family chloride channel protein